MEIKWVIHVKRSYSSYYLKVTPTSTFNLRFKLTDAVRVDFSGSSDTKINKMGADPIQALLSVSN